MRIRTLLLITALVACGLTFWRSHGGHILAFSLTCALTTAGCHAARIPIPIRRSTNQLAWTVIVLVFLLVWSIAPATKLVTDRFSTRTGMTYANAYNSIYFPVTQFYNLLPKSMQSQMRVHINSWLPAGTTIYEHWPKELGWTQSNPTAADSLIFDP